MSLTELTPAHRAQEPRPAQVAVVGAGVSGLVTARVLRETGFDVVVFEQREDLGGVWSASRRYPGIGTQDDSASYAFSDAPMRRPRGEHPPGAEVREYLEQYAERHGVVGALRLGTTVLRAEPVGDEGWDVESDGPAGRVTERFDWLVAANGVFSSPHVPAWPGREDFEAAGGRVLSPGELGDGEVLDGARTAVVGWGKTACDVAAAAATRSAGVAVVARTLMWKYPKRLGGPLTFRHAILTRAGERLILGSYRSPSGRLLLRRLPERVPRVLIGRLLARAIDRATGLSRLGLRPAGDIRSSNSLVTEGFFEAVEEGRIRVHRERTVAALGADADGPMVRLSGGEVLRADVLVAATGYEQRIPFIDEGALAAARTADGAVLLHRRTLGIDLPRFALAGWAHSYRSPLTSEVAAVWLAGAMLGRVRLPSAEAQRSGADRFRLTVSDAIGARTGALPGVDMRDLDTMLAELGAPLPLRVRLRQIWRPVDPADYAPSLRRALGAMRGAAVR